MQNEYLLMKDEQYVARLLHHIDIDDDSPFRYLKRDVNLE